MKSKQLFQISIAILFLFISTMGTSAQSSVSATVQTGVMLRSGPGTEWRILASLGAGVNVNLDGRDGTNSTWVRGITQNGQVGWMASRYLSASAGSFSNLPIIAWNAPLTVSAPGSDANASGANAGGVTVTGGVNTTTRATVNMRSGPSTDYRRVGVVGINEQFVLDGRNPAITWVRGVNSQGLVGWVSGEFVNMGFDGMAALPIVDVNSAFSLQVSSGASTSTTDTADTSTAPAVGAPPPLTSTTTISGFGYGGHVTGLDDNSVNYMRIAGMTWAKYQVRYDQGADPNAIAGLINDAHAKGFRILIGLVGHPHELNNGGYFEAFAGYAGGLAALGADAIEIWNEPNLDREWPFGQIDPVWYTGLLAQSFNAIKANNPNTYVISAALAPTGAEAAFPGAVVNDNSYLAGMVNAGALNYMDCVGAHYNEGIVPPTWNSGDPRSEYYTRYYNGMVDAYWNIVGGRRPICFTELGYLSPEGFGPLPGNFSWASNVTVAQQASWLDQVMNQARRSGRVRIVIIWNINFQQYGADPMGGYAIIRPDGGCPACFALGN